MDQKNFIVAIVLSVVIIMGWQTLFPAKPTPPQQQASQKNPNEKPRMSAQQAEHRGNIALNPGLLAASA